MSALLELKRDGVWAGRLALPLSLLPPPMAEPVVLTRNDHASIVFGCGAFTQLATLDLSRLILREARRPEIRLVYLAFVMQGGRLGSLATAAELLREARLHAAVITYLPEVAFGPALWLAYQTDMVIASPVASLGWLECNSEEGEFDGDASLGMARDLAELNPKLDAAQWARLTEAAVTGEQAEAMGIVGGLKRDVFDLSKIDPNSPRVAA